MAPKITTLEKRAKCRTYSVNFHGNEVILVTVTASPSVIGNWISQFAREDLRFVGIGVQWSPSHSAADTLQICSKKKCLIIQLAHCSRFPKRLRQFLRSDFTTFSGLWNRKDATKLLARSEDLKIPNLVDVREYMGSVRNRSVAEIVSRGLNRTISPDINITKSDWSQRRLLRAQILQATIDAHVSYELALNWIDKKEDSGSSSSDRIKL